MLIFRVGVSDAMGGGFITVRCEESSTVDELLEMVLDKVRAKRLQLKQSGSIQLHAADYNLSPVDGPSRILNPSLTVAQEFSAEKLPPIITLAMKPAKDTMTVLYKLSGLGTAHGKYVESDGNGGLHAGDMSAKTAWTILEGPYGTLYFRDSKDQFLSCDDQGRVYTTQQAGEWCRWRLEGGEYLRSVHGTYLTALTDGHFRCDAKGTWGKFDVVQELITGWIQKKSSSILTKWQSRYWVLANHHLTYWLKHVDVLAFMGPNAVAGLPEAKGSYDCSMIQTVQTYNDAPTRFTLHFFDKLVHLQTDTQQECKRWVDALQKEVERNNGRSGSQLVDDQKRLDHERLEREDKAKRDSQPDMKKKLNIAAIQDVDAPVTPNGVAATTGKGSLSDLTNPLSPVERRKESKHRDDRHREKERDKDRDKDRHRDKDSSRDKDKNNNRDKDRDKDASRDRHASRSHKNDKDKHESHKKDDRQNDKHRKQSTHEKKGDIERKTSSREDKKGDLPRLYLELSVEKIATLERELRELKKHGPPDESDVGRMRSVYDQQMDENNRRMFTLERLCLQYADQVEAMKKREKEKEREREKEKDKNKDKIQDITPYVPTKEAIQAARGVAGERPTDVAVLHSQLDAYTVALDAAIAKAFGKPVEQGDAMILNALLTQAVDEKDKIEITAGWKEKQKWLAEKQNFDKLQREKADRLHEKKKQEELDKAMSDVDARIVAYEERMAKMKKDLTKYIARSEEQETQIASMQKIIDKANSEQKQKISMTLANQEAASHGGKDALAGLARGQKDGNEDMNEAYDMLKEYYAEAETEYTARIETLTKKLAEAESQSENGSKIQSQFDAAKKEWNKKELDLQHQIESLNLELEMVQNKVSSLQAELELVQADKKSHIRSTSSTVGIEIEELKAAMAKSDQAHAEHMESLRDKLQISNNEIDTLHTRIAELEIQLSSAHNDTRVARSSSSAQSNDIDNDIIKKLKADLASRNAQINALQAQITSLSVSTSSVGSDDLQSERSLTQTLQQQLREHLVSLSEAHTTITSHETTITEQKKALATADAQLTQLLSDVSRMEATEVNLKAENAELLKQIDTLNTRINTLASTKTGNEEIDAWKLRLSTLESQLNERQIEINRIEKLCTERDTELERECELLNVKIHEYNKRAKDLNVRNEELKKKKLAFKKSVAEFEKTHGLIAGSTTATSSVPSPISTADES